MAIQRPTAYQIGPGSPGPTWSSTLKRVPGLTGPVETVFVCGHGGGSYDASMTLYEELLRLVGSLEAERIDYAICGGIAVAIHGYARFTRDIDILIRRDDIERVRALARKLEFDLEAGLIPFGKGTPKEREVFRVSKAAGPDVLSLDLVLVSPILEDVFASRVLVSWQQRTLQVVSRDGLAKMKRLAGRDQDRLDLKQLGFGEEEGAIDGKS